MVDEPVVLFDFGNTLADETWMTADLGVFPEWPDIYRRVVWPLASEWGLGRLTTADIAARLADEIGCETRVVLDHMIELYRNIRFYPRIMAAVRHRRDRGGRQALVTVNPADIAESLAPHGIPELFDLIVTSGQEGLDDKARLAVIAARRLGARLEQVILIDNIEANVASFQALGGRGYHFQSDEQFARDVHARRIPGFKHSDVEEV